MNFRDSKPSIFADFESRFRASKAAVGFTLIELLVATTIFVVLVLVLASISNQAIGIWSRNQNQSEVREAARSAMNLIGGELRQAVLPVYRADSNGLQFVINPSGVSSVFLNHDAIFWQAPIATSRTNGDLAALGYFIRKGTGNNGKLCRFFVNPDSSNYAVHGGVWVNDALLDSLAPASEATDFKGLFLDNVPGMWVAAYYNSTNGKEEPYTNYDSRQKDTNGISVKFPVRVEVTLAILDKAGADRVSSGQLVLPVAANFTNSTTYLDQVPAALRGNVQTVTINVPFLLE